MLDYQAIIKSDTATRLLNVFTFEYNSLFLDYCILGGMPAVVRQYIEKGTFEGILLPDDYNPVFFSGVKSGNKHLLSDALLWQMVLFWMKSCHLFFHDSQCRIWLSLC